MFAQPDTDPSSTSASDGNVRPPLPDAVLELQHSVEKLTSAAQAFAIRKSARKESTESALLLASDAASLVRAIDAACTQKPGDLHVLATSHLTVLAEALQEATAFIEERVSLGSVVSFVSRWGPSETIQVHALGIYELGTMLKVENGVARLLLDPALHLGLSDAKPTLDLPQLSTSTAAYDAFKIVIEGLGNMTDGLPWPWKAIPQTVLQFSKLIESAVERKEIVQDLIGKINQRIAILLDIRGKKGCEALELTAFVEIFFADVQRIIVRLRIVAKVNSVKAVALTDRIGKIIEEEDVRMRDAMQLLQTCFSFRTAYTVESVASSVAAIQHTVDATFEVVQSTHDMVEDMHVMMMQTSIGKQPIVPNRAKLPARPTFFNGRDELVDFIVQVICRDPAPRIAIMGSGGIGKTSLSLAVIHDERVVSLVEDARFFVSVEGAADAGAAAKLLATQLGIQESTDPMAATISYFETIPRALLVVDNLETLWFASNAAAQKDTERMLKRLANLPSLTLIVTSRGSVPPNNIQWSNMEWTGLAAFSLEAARDTFNQIVGRPQVAEESEALDTLLANVDCVPLAVTLLAQLAQLKNTPSLLLQRWQNKKTAFIRAGGKHRESSLDISIRVSLDLLAAMSDGAEGAQLLSICAHLPDGLRPPVFAQLCNQFGDIYVARDLLVAFALVSLGAGDELKMLSPVRHFVLEHHPITEGHAATLRKIYFDIAASGPVTMSKRFLHLAQNVAPEYGNLTTFLLYLIGAEEPSQELFNAVNAVSEYSYWTVPSTSLREALRLRLPARSAWLGQCLRGIGRTQMKRGEYSLAADNLQAACKLYAELGDRFQEAFCRRSLGQCLRPVEAAERELIIARDTFLELGHEFNAAQCTQALGNICRLRGEYDQAIVHLNSARDTCIRLGERLYAAQCTRNLGRVQLVQSNYSAAEAEFNSALSEFEALGEQFGAAQCALFLGDVRIRQKDFSSAEKQLVTAREAFSRLSDHLHLATCHQSFGELYRNQHRVPEALENYETARNLYETSGHKIWAAKCSDKIAKLRNSP